MINAIKKFFKAIANFIAIIFGKGAKELDSRFLVERVDKELEDDNNTLIENIQKCAGVQTQLSHLNEQKEKLVNRLNNLNAKYHSIIEKIKKNEANETDAVVVVRNINGTKESIHVIEDSISSIEATCDRLLKLIEKQKMEIAVKTSKATTLKVQKTCMDVQKDVENTVGTAMTNEGNAIQNLEDNVRTSQNEFEIKKNLGMIDEDDFNFDDDNEAILSQIRKDVSGETQA